MTGWLIDTNVVSEMHLARADPSVRAWVQREGFARFHVSAVTIMELNYGAETAPNAKRSILQAWIDEVILSWFGPRILAVDDATLLTWRRMMEAIKRQGSVSAAPDLLIAAQAQNSGLIVASRDVRIFAAAGAAVFNPWTYEFHPPGRASRKLSAGSLSQALQVMRRSR
jgi:hypothetical protein